jgi:hypothetical protein
VCLCAEAAHRLGLAGFQFEQGSIRRCNTVPHAAATPDLLAVDATGRCVVVELKCRCPFIPVATKGAHLHRHAALFSGPCVDAAEPDHVVLRCMP